MTTNPIAAVRSGAPRTTDNRQRKQLPTAEAESQTAALLTAWVSLSAQAQNHITSSRGPFTTVFSSFNALAMTLNVKIPYLLLQAAVSSTQLWSESASPHSSVAAVYCASHSIPLTSPLAATGFPRRTLQFPQRIPEARQAARTEMPDRCHRATQADPTQPPQPTGQDHHYLLQGSSPHRGAMLLHTRLHLQNKNCHM